MFISFNAVTGILAAVIAIIFFIINVISYVVCVYDSLIISYTDFLRTRPLFALMGLPGALVAMTIKKIIDALN